MTENLDPQHVRSIPDNLDVNAEAHTAEGLMVPYDKPTKITERRSDGIITYDEVFRRGACERAIRAPHRLMLAYTHDATLANRLGYGVEFREEADGLYGAFRLDQNRFQQALDVLTTSHRSLSVSFWSILPKPLTERAGSLVERMAVHLDHVAAVTDPAYPDARILTARADGADDEPTQAEKDYAELAERAKAALEAAEAAIAAGARWAKYRRDEDGRLDGSVDAE